MENCLDTIAKLNDASAAWRHPDNGSIRYQKLCSHISIQRESFFRCNQYDQLFLHPKSLTALRPWKRRLTKPLLSAEISVSGEYHFFFDISTNYWPYLTVLRVINTINVKKVLIRKENSHGVSFFFENLSEPNLQIFFRLIF